MNKQIKKYFMVLAACTCLTAPSCDVLDVDPTGWYSENVAYASLDNLDLYVKGFYGIFYANADIANGYIMDDGVSDLVKYSWYGDKGQVNRFFYESNYISPDGNFRSNWSDLYTRIRQFNEYFYDRSNGYGNKLDSEAVKVRDAEVRFMRAFAYQELTLRHGGVILRVAEDYVDGPEDRAKARSTEAECWEFVISEYEKAAQDLPASWSGSELGRLTKGAAYGMKARAALYAERWDDAQKACDEVLKLGYSLMSGTTASDYYKIFTTVGNSELILPVYYQQSSGSASSGKQHTYDNYFCPPYDYKAAGSDQVGATATPSDEYASTFDIKVNGAYEAFDWSNLASKYGNAPFTNREPRFYASILYNGAAWKGRTLALRVLADGEAGDGYMDFAKTGQDNVHKSTTGYIFRKFMSDNAKINFSSILSGQYWIEMRLAEIYLIRSEAYARQGEWGLAYDDLNTVHTRVGLTGLATQSNWNSYLADLSKERICELGLEGHRYFDLIRWGKAQEVLNNSRLHGIKITSVGGVLKYERVECDTNTRLFPAKYNIFPIPTQELRNNTLCKQTDTWL